jgi:hypothetical protein
MPSPGLFRFVLISIAGWMNQHQLSLRKKTSIGKATNCCSQQLSMDPNNAAILLRVATGSEVYLSWKCKINRRWR